LLALSPALDHLKVICDKLCNARNDKVGTNKIRSFMKVLYT